MMTSQRRSASAVIDRRYRWRLSFHEPVGGFHGPESKRYSVTAVYDRRSPGRSLLARVFRQIAAQNLICAAAIAGRHFGVDVTGGA
jgi:hypothetical protein